VPAALASIDARLARLVVPYEEWEVLYRQRLQTERDHLRVGLPGSHGGRNGTESGDRRPGVVGRVVRAIGQVVG
jgi:hypothetical protein